MHALEYLCTGNAWFLLFIQLPGTPWRLGSLLLAGTLMWVVVLQHLFWLPGSPKHPLPPGIQRGEGQ